MLFRLPWRVVCKCFLQKVGRDGLGESVDKESVKMLLFDLFSPFDVDFLQRQSCQGGTMYSVFSLFTYLAKNDPTIHCMQCLFSACTFVELNQSRSMLCLQKPKKSLVLRHVTSPFCMW